jgi:hypothetical protein
MDISYKIKRCSQLKIIKCENLLLFTEICDYDEIVYLHINVNNIFSLPKLSLPKLPKSLIKFDCYSTKLIELPKLPSYITRVNCSSNKLTSLPELPKSLKILMCSYNKLNILPELPSSLEYIDYEGNNLIKTIKYKYLYKTIF